MRFHWLLLLATLLLAADDAKKDAADKEKIQGTWKVVSLELEGKELFGDEVKEMKLIISADKIGVDGDFPDKDKFAQFTYKIDPATTPKILDATVSAGEDKDRTMEAIYRLDGDKLQICFRLIGKERPGEFATKAGSGLALVKLERLKS